MIFLIEYERSTGIVEMHRFDKSGAEEARRARLSLELKRAAESVTREIVILEADSEEQLRRTHSRYFESLNQLANPDRALDALKAA
ncbi:MAG: hypothetical protein ACK5YB_06995 [Burkholderiales bacterium]|jgi:hypothetical protein